MFNHKHFFLVLVIALGVAGPASFGQTLPPSSVDDVINRIAAREKILINTLAQYRPLAETYIQVLSSDQELGSVPKYDKYFLGKIDFKNGINDQSFLTSGFGKGTLQFLRSLFSFHFMPRGFAQMVLLDQNSFNRNMYKFEYVRREFLGDLRCVVFDITPSQGPEEGRFKGRLWAEDQDYNIVRFNGVYVSAPHRPHLKYYFHFDSWRVNMGPDLWLPAFVYSEESDMPYLMARRKARFKAQTRLWGYGLKPSGSPQEFTTMFVDAPTPVRDGTETEDMTPVRSLRAWERQAEDNVLQRLEKSGLLAPAGEPDKILETVVNNLEVTSNLNIQPEVRCRVLLTQPLESFAIGHTIVLSRGMIDVLPDEASLAMMLAHELAHIALGHRIDTKYAFSDRMLFGDEKTFGRIHLKRDPKEEEAADRKAMEILKNSPYKDKLGNAGLFLRAVANRAAQLPNLIQPHLGDRIARGGTVVRMAQLMQSAPQLQVRDVNQIAALPLGSRIKVDPWNDHIEMIKAKPVALVSAREKMPFEVAPVFVHLTRHGVAEPVTGDSAQGQPADKAVATTKTQATDGPK